MKHKYIIITVFTILCFTFPSCVDFDKHYEGEAQDLSQIEDTENAVPARAEAALNGMYALLGRPGVCFPKNDPLRADDFGYPALALSQDINAGIIITEVSGYDWFSVCSEFSDRIPNYANPTMRYSLPYKVIFATKGVLDAISDDTDSPDAIARRGQAKAMRAWAYLSLAPYFQFRYALDPSALSVPITVPGSDLNNNPRALLEDLYAYILEDLDNAIADLEGFVRPHKGQIVQSVAYGLRARAYMYMEKWVEAAADAEKALIGYTPYSITEVSTPTFYESSHKSWMWGIILPSSLIGETLLSWPSQIGSFSGSAYTAYAVYRQINKRLYDKISDTDVRKGWWLNESKQSPLLNGLCWEPTTIGGVVYTACDQDIVGLVIPDTKIAMPAYSNVKFGQRRGIGSPYNEGDWCMMRAEEMILIRAEALYKSGQQALGQAVLVDFVTTYRDPSYTLVGNFENEVWMQRRIELWGEGFAMADAMRLGKNIVRFVQGQPTNVPEDYRFNIAANDPWLLLRFVNAELSNNMGVVQNTGGSQPNPGDGGGLTDGL
ncbi:MAG: RagB/SusD family nutrient uptake outer membrane protein [Prevotellaceae bacterium]|jgi:tetratricopeptide (TPR) repeat protein|nr:RagB/SusD family nutrient uptake outer membrane protein [Prevotellaceae bacterium]